MRIGIISFAHVHAAAYAGILCARTDIQFIGICDNNNQRGSKAAARFKVPYFSNMEDFFAARPEGVLICSENSLHSKLAFQAAEHDCAVLCEKPLAISVQDGQRMVDLFRKKKLLLMTAFPMRYSAPIEQARKLSAEIGEIYGISSVNQGRLPEDNWFVDKKLSGGGALTDHLVHLCDIFYWILGKEAEQVYARSNSILHSQRNLEVETGALVMLKFREGPFVSIDCSWSRPDSYPVWGGLSFNIAAQKGNMTVDAFGQTVSLYFHGQKPRLDYWGSDSNALMIEDFIYSFRQKSSPRVTGEDGLKTLRAVAAAYRSAQSGNTVQIQ